ncbi:hypothetical protein FRB95_013573 [Tulasnella sp. JGI-2019a]|nr:hypothetical protein FRB95_013573 [Tulasnella sp. JGI-2019a]
MSITTNSLSSPTSTTLSASPSPATPLTPNSGHHVSFASQNANSVDQFAFENALDNNTAGVVPAPTSQGGPVRRKPSRRANTAERRATHNAVERQRRETLNGRFLDLAALLPNLASVRRPSKSAIVNSSIALIHTQRRSRSTAARELRLLKLEADALRAEVNEWRERAGMGLARIDEPIRSREFEELVSGGLEEAEESLLEEERKALEIAKEGLRLEAASGYTGDLVGNNFAYNMNGGYDDEEDTSNDGRMRPGSQGSNHGNGNSGMSLPMPISVPRQTNINMQQHSNPMIFDPSSALLQAHPTHNIGIQNQFSGFDLGTIQQPLGLTLGPVNKQAAAWNAQHMYNPNQYNNGYQQNYSPPSSAHGPASANFLASFGLGDDGGDASSVSSGSLSDNLSSQFHLQHQHQLQEQAHQQQFRTRSSSSVNTLRSINTAMKPSTSPPSSAPATATTYAEAGSAGDAFAAAYGSSFPMGVGAVRVPGGGNTFNAAMGLFM